jgi:ribosomal protein S18 acetylase RimI-like enzyme
MLIIRQYQPKDKEAVKALHFAGLEQFGAKPDAYHDDDLNHIEKDYLNNGGEFLVGTESGEIVVIGAIKNLTFKKGEIKRVRVRRDFQRRGYGQSILAKLLERAVELGYDELCLDTLAGNILARRFFEKQGFAETRRGKARLYDLVFYNKWLK